MVEKQQAAQAAAASPVILAQACVTRTDRIGRVRASPSGIAGLT